MDYKHIHKPLPPQSGGFSPGRLRAMLLGVEKKRKEEEASEAKFSLRPDLPECDDRRQNFITYGLGWRGGLWYANRKFRREQLKLMGHLKPHGWQFLRKPLVRFRRTLVNKTAELPVADAGPPPAPK